MSKAKNKNSEESGVSHKNQLIFTFIVALAVFIWVVLGAGSDTPEALADRVVSAIRAQDAEKYLALVHPDCPAGSVTKARMEGNISWFHRERGGLKSKYSVQVETASTDYINRFNWGTLPTKVITIISDSDKSKNPYAIARKGNKWHIVNCRTRK